MLKILSIFGTRPEAIKMAPVIARLNSYSDAINSRVCITAQHREMLDQVLAVFDIQPDYDLNVMQPGQSLSEVTSRVISKLDPILAQEKPDWVLVQGDTTTTMVGALAAFYHRVKVGHIEAGLRTDNKWQPYPEEINRRMVSVVADLNFAPTQTSKNNLVAEGIDPNSIEVTGNTVIDALWMAVQKPFNFDNSVLADIPWEKEILLLTAHRRESFGKPLKNICQAVRTIAEGNADSVHVVFPVHPNPQVRNTVYPLLGDSSNISLIEPLDYLPFVHLLKRAHLVLTDSGGIQEEAPGFGIPVLVLREITERPEGLQSGTVKLVGTDQTRIISEVKRLLSDSQQYTAMAQAVNPYGDGKAAERIVSALLRTAGD